MYQPTYTLALVFMLFMRVSTFAADPPQPTPADPLTATIHTEDAERFARLFAATNGKPSAEQIQKEYLDDGSYGVAVFTPYRIQNAAHLAEAVASDGPSYDRAIRECLPRLKQYNADLRSIYLAMHGLYPDKPLPQIYVVFGAGNSGGTAGPTAQVLGLEVICKTGGDIPEGLRTTLRRFFAHETVHTFQNYPTGPKTSPLLANVLTEGGADFIASIVTGETPEPQRANWLLNAKQTCGFSSRKTCWQHSHLPVKPPRKLQGRQPSGGSVTMAIPLQAGLLRSAIGRGCASGSVTTKLPPTNIRRSEM